MTYDLLITDGTIVDGAGSAPYVADLAIADGRIVEIGDVSGPAKRVIKAEGRAVTPGFVDPHTHYDAQLWWDQTISPSPWHGVTTVLLGNCGVGIAPCRPEWRNTVLHDLVNVEGMPFDVLEKGVTWKWESFPEFMMAAQERGSAPNLAFLAPLTPFRYYVMGEDAFNRAASQDEAKEIAKLLHGAMTAGAYGFSTTQLPNHIGYLGRPLACQNADRSELKAYANVLRQLNKGGIEIALTQQVSVVSDRDYEMLDFLLNESRRPVTWLSLLYRDDMPEACDESFRKAEPLIRRGALPQISARPLTRDIDLKAPMSFMGFPSWHQVFNKNVGEQMKIYADKTFRDKFREELKGPGQFTGDWEVVSLASAVSPSLKPLEGKSIAAIARERGVDGVDAMLDVAVADELRSEFTLAFTNTNQAGVAKLLQNPGTLIGLSDGGAHVGVLCDAGYCTYLLGTWVRERQVLSLEHAVKRITSEPADFWGIKDRGRLKVGLAADIAVFDPATVGSDERGEKQYDLPGGAKRVVMRSRGVDFTIVNGSVVYENGSMTDSLGGRVLRS